MLTLPISPLAKILWKRRRVSIFVAQQSSYTEIACCHVLLLYFIKFIFISFPLFAIGLETVLINKCLTESPTLSLKLMTRLIRILRRSLRRSISSRVSCISLFKISNIFGASVRMGGSCDIGVFLGMLRMARTSGVVTTWGTRVRSTRQTNAWYPT